MARVSPIRSVLEWLAAAALLVGAVWAASGLLRDWVEPRVAADRVAEAADVNGIPGDATEVPLLVLLDGTEIKVGDAHARLVAVLGEEGALGPSRTTHGPFGERWVRAYQHGTTKFFVVCERADPNATLKVARIYLP